MYDYMKSLQRQFETKPEYIQDLKAEVNQTHKELSALLSKEDRRLLLKLVDLEDALRGEATLHSFVSGYRLACVLKIYSRLWYYCGQTKNHRQIGGDFPFRVDPRRIELPNLSDANRTLSQLSYGPI